SQFKKATSIIFEGYKEMTTSYQELMIMEEELSWQYEELEKSRNALEKSDQRYQLAVEGANDGIWDWDIQADTYFFSIKLKEVFGYEDGELENTFETWQRLLHPDDYGRTMKQLGQYMGRKEGIYENTYRLRCKEGEYRWILSRGKGVWDAEGTPIRIAGSHTDITEQIELQEILRSEKELSESIIREAPMLIVILDTDANITQFNPFSESLSGYKEQEVLGKNFVDLMIPYGYKDRAKNLFKQIIDQKHLRNNEIDILTKDGRIVTILWNNNLLHDENGNIQGITAIGADISERINMERRLHTMAYHDSLTRLPNRTLLTEVAETQILYAEQSNKKFAFVYIDIDNFKNINDTMGHAVGDKLIVYIGNILSKNIFAPNIVARLGGDEFAVLLVDVETEQDIIDEADRILKYFKKPWVLNGTEFFISVSIGIAIYPEHGKNLLTLMQNADTAMFRVKEIGKDGFCIFTTEMREKMWKHTQMTNQLISAIQNEEFLLYYQPLVDLKSEEIIGVEALIRWIHPEKGFVPPMEFITFAENTGHIGPIGDWVLKTAFMQKNIWNERGCLPVKMSVNLSGKSLLQKGLVEKIRDMLQEYHLEGRQVELEVTETAIMTDMKRAIEVLNQLKELGVTIALDDFGTGYSSLTYLQKLPIDILKVDRQFIKSIKQEDEELFIFQSIIQLAHNLGLKVVVEGIETKEQKAFVIKNGCDIGQGYYFSRPVPESEMEMILQKRQLLDA
ncbi:MAG: gmr, partial [Oscillospiraceae bacterium]|nr:gmr [Oscillospiraceae bacterium]